MDKISFFGFPILQLLYLLLNYTTNSCSIQTKLQTC